MTPRLKASLAAQTYSQVVTLGVQLGSVPLLIAAWGIERYGVWLLLTAIPAYLAFSDFGFTFIAKNDMAIRVSGGDFDGAIETFQSIFVLLIAAMIAIGGLSALLIATLPLDQWFNLGPEPLRHVQLVLGAQVGSVLLYQLTLLLFAGVRCVGRPATETAMAASFRMLEAGAVVVTALTGGDLVSAALAGLGVRAVSLAALALWLRTTTPWLTLGVDRATGKRLSSLSGPSFTYMLVPLSNAALIQGPLVVLGVVATPSAVALFSVTRTVARLGMSGANMLNFAFTPEYSFAYGRRDQAAFARLLWHHTLLMLAGVTAYGICIVLLGSFGVRLISHGELAAIPSLSLLLGFSVALEMIWSALFSPLSAVNAHKTAAVALAIFTGLSAVAVAPNASMSLLAGALVCVNAGMIMVTVIRLKRFRWPA